jgi:hypothetical protein
MQILDISEEVSHPRLVEPVMASWGKRKEKRRTFVGCAVLGRGLELSLTRGFFNCQRFIAADGFEVEEH